MGQNCAKDLVVREKQHCLCHEEIGLAEGNHFDALLKCWSRDTVVCTGSGLWVCVLGLGELGQLLQPATPSFPHHKVEIHNS